MISFEVSLPSSFPPPPLLKRLKRSAANTGVDGTDCGGDGDGVLSVLLRDTRLARCFGGGGGGVVGAAELDGTSRRPRARLCHRERTKLTHPPPSMFLFPSLTCRNHLRRAAQRHHSDYLYGAIAAACALKERSCLQKRVGKLRFCCRKKVTFRAWQVITVTSIGGSPSSSPRQNNLVHSLAPIYREQLRNFGPCYVLVIPK